MEEEKPKIVIIGGGSAKNFGVTDMQVYRNFETDEVTSSPPLNKGFTIEQVDHTHEYLSGREKRRERRKQQRKNG